MRAFRADSIVMADTGAKSPLSAPLPQPNMVSMHPGRYPSASFPVILINHGDEWFGYVRNWATSYGPGDSPS